MATIIAGATGAIGSEPGRRLSAAGNRLVLVARDGDRLAAFAEELGGAITIAADRTDASAAPRRHHSAQHDRRAW